MLNNIQISYYIKRLEYLETVNTYDRKRIFRAAWHKVRTEGGTLSYHLTGIWERSKYFVESNREEIIKIKLSLSEAYTPKEYNKTVQHWQESTNKMIEGFVNRGERWGIK